MTSDEGQSSDLSKFSCLVLEDDDLSANLIAEAVRLAGGIAVVCDSLRKARITLPEARFDLMVLDHQLPDGTGTEFFYELREQGIWVPVIMLTGMPDLANAVELTRKGLFGYLAKPFELDRFMACLRRAVLQMRRTDLDAASTDFVGDSIPMRNVRRLIQQAAAHHDAPLLLTGETGTGKDLTARIVHNLTFQGRVSPPAFVSLNCSTLPADMFEAELFGAEKGAYTGAHQQRVGLVEAAQGGTLFLDEIAEVPLHLQAKLLRFLETREYRRLGSTEARQFDGRIVAATNRSLQEEVARGRFRSDLWYRLDVLAIHLPPLRERPDDIPPLAERLLDGLAKKYSSAKPLLRPDDLDALVRYDFPGNVRELRNILERSLLQTPPDSSWLELDRSWLRRERTAIPITFVAAHEDPTAASPPPPAPSRPVPAEPDASESAAGPPPAVTVPIVSAAAAAARGGDAIPLPAGRVLSPLEAQEYRMVRQAMQEADGAIRRAAAKLGLSHQALLRRLEKWPELRPAPRGAGGTGGGETQPGAAP